MLPERDSMNIHERFKELSALANARMLTAGEWSELKEHLSLCESCREIHNEYLLLDREGMPMLAATFARRKPSQESWDDTATRAKLLARVQAAEQANLLQPAAEPVTVPRRFAMNPFAWAAVAACVIVLVAFGAYRLGHKSANEIKQAQTSAEQARFDKLAAEKRAVSNLLDSQTKRLSQLEAEASTREAERSSREQEVAKLRSEFQVQDDHLKQLAASKNATEEQLRTASQQRDSLSGRLQAAEQAYEAVQAELVSLRAERDRETLRLASLENENTALIAGSREQERRLKNQEQFLSSDRDIRELMGARQLYIADVYDIDSSSRTKKPFGRVFYTQGKSLIFYAFDLDRGPGLKNASTFQVWGRKSSDEGKPFNLGILYQDSTANRRWFLRSDDPQQLAEINAVFVTVEPNGGSVKPTGKPFLYALLRKEVNHP